jgi:FixG-like putative oxidoreductase
MYIARVLSGFLLLSLLAPLATAQNQLDPVLSLAADVDTLSAGPDDAPTIKLTLTNTGQTPGTVTLTMPTVAGWTFTPTPAGTITVNNGATTTVNVAVKAVPTDTAAPQNGNAVFAGTIRHATTNRGNTAQDTVALTYNAPAPPVAPAPPRADYTGWIVAGISLVILAAAAVAFYFVRSGSVQFGAPQLQKDIDRGTGDAYAVRIENKSRTARTVQLRVAELPPRWVAAFSFPEVKLQPREAATVPVFVRVPNDTPTGAVGRVRIQARPGDYSAWLAKADLLANVTDVRGERPNAFPEAAPRSAQGALDQVARST